MAFDKLNYFLALQKIVMLKLSFNPLLEKRVKKKISSYIPGR
jgi:hypothetical protein